MSRINVANFRHPDGTSDNISLDDSGRVGIGTSTPSGVGDRIVEIYSSGSISELHLTNSTSTNTAFRGLTHTLNGVDAYAYNRENGSYIFGTNNTERARITSTGDFRFNSGFGSVGTAYGCRVWVNFNGTGSVSSNQTINGSGNVSSVYKTGTGLYTVNFANAMPDANYSVVAEAASGSTGNIVGNAPQTTQVNIIAYTSSWSTGDRNPICVAVFR